MKANKSAIMKSTAAITLLKFRTKQRCHGPSSCLLLSFLNLMPVTICSRKWRCLLLLCGLQHQVHRGVCSCCAMVDSLSAISWCCCRIRLCQHIAASKASVNQSCCCCGWLPGMWSGIVGWQGGYFDAYNGSSTFSSSGLCSTETTQVWQGHTKILA